MEVGVSPNHKNLLLQIGKILLLRPNEVLGYFNCRRNRTFGSFDFIFFIEITNSLKLAISIYFVSSKDFNLCSRVRGQVNFSIILSL